MDLLVLGGTHHVGRSVVEVALGRGDTVTTVTRGVSGPSKAGAREIHADRTDVAALAEALGDDQWDAAIDTWSGAPVVVAEAATLLAGRVGHYGYVSSRSVHGWPMTPGMDETAPVVDADPASPDASDYARAKRGGELAAIEAFGERALLARAGLILGPYEQMGRLPWWLSRIDRGGLVVAPGPRDRKLQYIDGRDLAEWMLASADRGLGGAFNTVSRPGHATISEVLDTAVAVTGSDARLVWVAPDVLDAAGISGWTQLPIWLPPTGEAAGLHDGDVSAAYAEGLHCRPVAETVADTWRWLQAEGYPPALSDVGSLGLDPDLEEMVLADAT